MRLAFHTSLLTLIFVVGASDAFAAPAVRQLGVPVASGSTGTGSTSASANSASSSNTMSSRAGSLRTGGYVGQRATVSTSGSGASDSASDKPQSVAAGSSVSTGSVGLGRGPSQRLSIGSYIGNPRQQVSTDIPEVDLSGYVEKFQGKDVAGEALVVGDDGWVTTGEFVTPEQLETDLSGKVDKDQGVSEAGKALMVDETGFVTTGEVVTPDELGDYVEKDQGIGAAGHVLSVDADGMVTNVNEVYYKPEMDVKLAEKVDVLQGRQYKGKALVVDNDGKVKPIGEIPDSIDISGKVDKFQGPERAGNALIVNEYGYVQPTGDFVETDQGVKNAGKVLIINPNGIVKPGDVDFSDIDIDGKVDKFQTTDNADTVLVVNEEGWVADEKIKNIHVADDAALERKKMAADITDTLDWIDVWKNQAEDSEAEDPALAYKLNPDERYVMALDEFGEKAWFRVVTTAGQ